MHCIVFVLKITMYEYLYIANVPDWVLGILDLTGYRFIHGATCVWFIYRLGFGVEMFVYHGHSKVTMYE